MRISNESINMVENDTDFLHIVVTDNKTGVSYTIYKVNTSSMWKLAKATKLWRGHSEGNFMLELFLNGMCTMTIPREAIINKDR